VSGEIGSQSSTVCNPRVRILALLFFLGKSWGKLSPTNTDGYDKNTSKSI
jgi:hypothetical protein